MTETYQFPLRIIASGSSGNCVRVGSILIDFGIPKKAFLAAGEDPTTITDLFISHRHSDHFNPASIAWAFQQGWRVHLPQDALDLFLSERGSKFNRAMFETQIDVTRSRIGQPQSNTPLDKYIIDDIQVELVPQKHDDVTSYAFVFTHSEGGETYRMLYSTDLDTLEPTDVGEGLYHLGMFDVIVLEGNYDETWLREYIETIVETIDPTTDASTLTDDELRQWANRNYESLTKEYRRGLYRALQNRRHLSKQQARAYVKRHLKPGGTYYEVHRSGQFYEKPWDWNGGLI